MKDIAILDTPRLAVPTTYGSSHRFGGWLLIEDSAMIDTPFLALPTTYESSSDLEFGF